MGESVFGEVGHGAAGFFNDVVGSRSAGRHTFVGDVGDVEKFGLNLTQYAVELFRQSFLLFFENGHTFLGFLGIVFAAFFHGLADSCGHAVELGGGCVVFLLQFAAQLIERDHARNRFFAVEAFDGKPLYDKFRIGFYLL